MLLQTLFCKTFPSCSAFFAAIHVLAIFFPYFLPSLMNLFLHSFMNFPFCVHLTCFDVFAQLCMLVVSQFFTICEHSLFLHSPHKQNSLMNPLLGFGLFLLHVNSFFTLRVWNATLVFFHKAGLVVELHLSVLILFDFCEPNIHFRSCSRGITN